MENRHNFVPKAVNPRTIGIIGGRGAMGQLLAREFSDEGYRVLVTSEDPASHRSGRSLVKLNKKLVRESDVVVLAVPITVIKGGLNQILGNNFLRGLREKLFLDITSTKIDSMRQMSRIVGATVIGTHPMFGPTVAQFAGQNVFVTPLYRGHPVLDARLEKWLAWLSGFWQQRGAVVHYITPEEHDELVSYLQFAVLFVVALFGDVMREAQVDLQRLRKVSTPNSLLITAVLGRMIRPETAELYANIVAENPCNARVAELFAAAANKLASLTKSRDQKAIASYLRSLGADAPVDFRNWANNMTSYIQTAIAKRPNIEKQIDHLPTIA